MKFSTNSVRRSFSFALILKFALIISFADLGGAAYAMTFKLYDLNDGTRAVRATGRIEWGDHERLRAIAPRATIGPQGRRILVLNSPGGELDAALMVSEVIDEMQFTTVVAWNDSCLSACGSILFLSGDARMLLGDGRIGLHQCAVEHSTPDKINRCNADIAIFAGKQGYSPDMLYMGMKASSAPDDWIMLKAASGFHCYGFQNPFGLSGTGSTPPPCVQLLGDGKVSEASDWDAKPRRAKREPMVPGTPLNFYLLGWSPPDGWSYTIAYDGVGIGFRRWGHFPSGPELTLACLIAEGEEWLILHRNLRRRPDQARPAWLRLRVGRAVHTLPLKTSTTGRANWGNRTEAFIDTNAFGVKKSALWVMLGLSRTIGENIVMVDILGVGGEILDTLAVPAGGALRRIGNIANHCVGRYPGFR